ncbi:MAG: hypothetical protein IJX82_00150 [Clostridia bacterium]|nr:hypothetical protein [Clostridia bacterium]
MSAFSIFTDRKKRKKNTETPTVEQYYEKRARRVSHLRYACLLVTVLFGVYGFAVHGEVLTAENFRYMLKFLDLTENDEASLSTEIRYDYVDSNQGALFKGDLAVLNTDGLTVYSREAGTTGSKLFSESFRMEDPRLVATAQNIFAYDLGGNEVRMFNSYSQIARLSMDYPIYGFSASDSGHFAVITAEKNYRSAIYVYDAYARQIYKRLLSNTYIDYVALSPDGQTFLALGHEAGGGYLCSLLQVYSVKEEQPLKSMTFKGELPLMAGYLADGAYAVLTGSALRFYDGQSDTPAKTLSMEGAGLAGCRFENGYVLITATGGGLSDGTELTVYDRKGEIALRTPCQGVPSQVRFTGDTLYLLTSEEVTVLPAGGESTSCETKGDAVQLLFDEDGTPVVFEKNLAYRLTVTQKEETE